MPLFNPASAQAADLRGVWIIFGLAALLVAAFVCILIFICVVAWGRKHKKGVPPQFESNPPLEILGVVIPTLIVIGLFYITFVRMKSNDAIAPHPYATVDVKGFRWSWEFSYPGHAVTIAGTPQQAPQLILPLGQMTQINLYSVDVDHAFWVPAFLFKRDALPGYTNHFDVTPTRLGVFEGKCAEFCGLDHAQMTFTVRVVSVTAYNKWLRSRTHVTNSSSLTSEAATPRIIANSSSSGTSRW